MSHARSPSTGSGSLETQSSQRGLDRIDRIDWMLGLHISQNNNPYNPANPVKTQYLRSLRSTERTVSQFLDLLLALGHDRCIYSSTGSHDTIE
jgi:hypothetical protein